MASGSTNQTASQEAKGFLAKNKVTLILLLVIALSNTGIYLYQQNKISKIETESSEKIDAQAIKAREMVSYRAKTAAECTGRAIAFACGAEMATGDKQRLNLFFINMVQNTEAELISIVDTLGMVYISTDKNYENQSILDVVPALPPVINEPTTQQVNEYEFLFAAPIEFGRRLGTLVLDYKTNKKTQEYLDEIAKNPLKEKEE